MVAFGKVIENKSGVKSRLIPGATVWSGWSVEVRDSNEIVLENGTAFNPFITRMLVKTLDANVASKLESATGSTTTLRGFLKSENLAKKDETANFVQFFYVVDVDGSETEVF